MKAAWRFAPLILAAAPIAAQETPPAEPVLPPEGSVIVNLPSADLPKLGTLTLLISHRFSQPVSDSDYHTLFSFDSAANINIGMAYVPLQNLEVSFERAPERCFCGLSAASSSKAQRGLEVYEFGAKYRFLASGPFRLSLRMGGDWRTAANLEDRSGFFAQGVLGLSIGSRVRLTAVPTYVSRTSHSVQFERPNPYTDVFNVPVALSIGVTRTFNVHGEVVPRAGDAGSRGTGWIASVEKTVLRHRFAFTIGNLRATTVDQYIGPDFRAAAAIPAFRSQDYFLGFNITRLWSLK